MGNKSREFLLLIPPLHQQVLSSISLSPRVEVEIGPDCSMSSFFVGSDCRPPLVTQAQEVPRKVLTKDICLEKKYILPSLWSWTCCSWEHIQG